MVIIYTMPKKEMECSFCKYKSGEISKFFKHLRRCNLKHQFHIDVSKRPMTR